MLFLLKIEKEDQPGLKKEDWMLKHSESRFVQIVAEGVTEAEEVLASVAVEDVAVAEVVLSPPLGDFVGDSEEVVVAGSLRILNIG